VSWGGSYRATPTATRSSSSTTATVTKATGTASGDLILLAVIFAGTSTFSCTGFTADSSVSSTGTNCCYQLLRRVADGSEGSTFTVTASPAADSLFVVGQIVVENALIDAKATTAESGGSGTTSCALTGVTVGGSNELLLWVAGGLANNTATGITPTLPAGFTSRAASSSGSTFQPDILISDNASIGSGSSGTISSTFGTASYWAGAQIAIKPALVATGGLLMMT
jgi:hypothetical protein